MFENKATFLATGHGLLVAVPEKVDEERRRPGDHGLHR
jgi:hypothetical protein